MGYRACYRYRVIGFCYRLWGVISETKGTVIQGNFSHQGNLSQYVVQTLNPSCACAMCMLYSIRALEWKHWKRSDSALQPPPPPFLSSAMIGRIMKFGRRKRFMVCNCGDFGSIFSGLNELKTEKYRNFQQDDKLQLIPVCRATHGS